MTEKISITPSELQEIIEQAISKFKKDVKPEKSKRKYLRIREFAEIFGMHKQSIHDLILKKKINAIQMDGTTAWRIPISEVERYEKESGKSTKKNIFTRTF